ncbi:hypothetical protein F4860DRAFT_516022 [Xylaria cubensis]|nr:hypothetical protein F4860DRAFT_516022 [Xylaria cubensis]
MERIWAFFCTPVLLPDCGTVLVDLLGAFLCTIALLAVSNSRLSQSVAVDRSSHVLFVVSGNDGFEDSCVALINERGAWGQKELVWLAVEPLNAENIESNGESTARFEHKYLNLKLTALLGSKCRLKDDFSMASTQQKSGFPPNLHTLASLGPGTSVPCNGTPSNLRLGASHPLQSARNPGPKGLVTELGGGLV